MAEAMRHRSVSSPRSSNRTCGFPACGFARGKVKNSFPASTPFLLLANNGLSDHVADTSALPPTADLPRPEFEVCFTPNTRHSATPAGLPPLTPCGHRAVI